MPDYCAWFAPHRQINRTHQVQIANQIGASIMRRTFYIYMKKNLREIDGMAIALRMVIQFI